MTRLCVLSALTTSLFLSSATLAAQSTAPSTANQPTNSMQSYKITHLTLKTSRDQISYSIGADLGQNFKEQGIDVDPAVLLQGLKDAIQGHLLLSGAQMTDILKNLQQELVAKKGAEMKASGEKNQQAGQAFMAEFKKKPGVMTTASGIAYKIDRPGQGDSPTDNSEVKVSYVGRFIDGKIFDQSKEPVTFPVNQVIPGWTEILKLMKPGAKFEVVIPSELAYGERGAGSTIGPNQTLVFTIDLIAIKK